MGNNVYANHHVHGYHPKNVPNDLLDWEQHQLPSGRARERPMQEGGENFFIAFRRHRMPGKQDTATAGQHLNPGHGGAEDWQTSRSIFRTD